MSHFQTKRSVIAALALLVAGGTVFMTEQRLRGDRRRMQTNAIAPHPLLGHFTMGHRRGVSSLLWLDLLTWYGGNVRLAKSQKITQDSNIDHLIEQTRLIIDLDPDFTDPYTFAPVILAWQTDRPLDGLPFIREAMIRFPNDWNYPFYYGFFHFWFAKDRQVAAQYFLKASRLPGCPPFIALLGAKLVRETEGSGDAIQVLETLLLSDAPPEVKEDVKKEIVTLNALEAVENAIAEYKRRYGKVPTMLELLKAKLLDYVPTDAEGEAIVINKDGHAVATTGGLH